MSRIPLLIFIYLFLYSFKVGYPTSFTKVMNGNFCVVSPWVSIGVVGLGAKTKKEVLGFDIEFELIPLLIVANFADKSALAGLLAIDFSGREAKFPDQTLAPDQLWQPLEGSHIRAQTFN